MQCTLFCTQGACILIRAKKKQRRKILLSCTAFHHLLCMKFVHKHDDMVSMLNRWEVKSKYHPINTSHQNTWRNVWFWFQNIWTTSEVASVQVLLQGYCRDRWPQNHLQEWSGMGIQISQWIKTYVERYEGRSSLTFLFFCVTEHLQKTLSLFNLNYWLRVSCVLATHRIL